MEAHSECALARPPPFDVLGVLTHRQRIPGPLHWRKTAFRRFQSQAAVWSRFQCRSRECQQPRVWIACLVVLPVGCTLTLSLLPRRHLDLSDNMLKSLSGVTFALADCMQPLLVVKTEIWIQLVVALPYTKVRSEIRGGAEALRARLILFVLRPTVPCAAYGRRASTKTSSSSSGRPWRPLPARPLKTLRSRPSPKAGDGVRRSTWQARCDLGGVR